MDFNKIWQVATLRANTMNLLREAQVNVTSETEAHVDKLWGAVGEATDRLKALCL